MEEQRVSVAKERVRRECCRLQSQTVVVVVVLVVDAAYVVAVAVADDVAAAVDSGGECDSRCSRCCSVVDAAE